MLPPFLEKVLDRFKRLPDDRTRTEAIIYYCKRLAPMPAELKTDETKVPGCVSNVFITSELQDGKMHYLAAADALTTRGVVAILVEGFNGLSPEEVLSVPPEPFKESGIVQSLSASRANGFYNILNRIREEAMKHLASVNSQPRANS
ncbi:SufE family protein [Leptolyngbya sp. FACHB-261]|uniref:SufE family protein n=1 Tax=Leptolyngbya sp. FACHB-261 TaxID=2692806 RepID=UPI00168950CF|nr:SufE family protein [Leptolyngbya sp. FACHB-261]MBD2104640.1 SufE family protein [Leptolyngbya sp. FACHB-261]